MSIKRASMFVAAAFATSGAIAMAQAPSVSFAGCVQKESSVLKRTPVVANAGMDDEFVLTFAKPSPAPGMTDPKPDAAPPEATGTSGSPGNFGTVYRLTGDKEKDLKSFVGQRVEISGTVKEKDKAADTMSSIGTSGRTELTPDNTAEITIDAIKPVSGACAPAVK
jgi:hypothetical protein